MKRIPLLSTLLFVAMLVAVPSVAQEAAEEPEEHLGVDPGEYPGDSGEGRDELERRLQGAVVPISNALAYLLGAMLPDENGEPRPLGLSIAPETPDEEGPFEIVFQCIWGPVICEPFFQACAAIPVKCSDGTGPVRP